VPQDVSGRYVGNAENWRDWRVYSNNQKKGATYQHYGRAGAGKTALACKALGDLRRSEQKTLQLSGIICLSAIVQASRSIAYSQIWAAAKSIKNQAFIDAISGTPS